MGLLALVVGAALLAIAVRNGNDHEEKMRRQDEAYQEWQESSSFRR